MTNKTEFSDDQWRQELNPEQYRVCRQKGTEAPFTGAYEQCKTAGTYHCVCCGNPLFESATKYNSGSGWPSFWDAQSDQSLHCDTDSSHGVTRTEVTCQSCGAHLGHVFEDGPQPTGLRYCINSVALDLKARS